METTLKIAPRKILIVEDVDDILEVVLEMVKLLGHQTLVARNGLEAVAIAQSELPDLILMDVWMPKKNGTAAAREIRAIPACAQIPIIRLSAFDEPTNEAGEHEHFDWDAYLSKPIDFDLFAEIVDRMLEQAASP